MLVVLLAGEAILALTAVRAAEAGPDVQGPQRQEMLARIGKVAFVRRGGYGMSGTNATMIGRSTYRGSAICVMDPQHPDLPPQVIYETKDGFIFDMNPSYDGTKLVFSHKTTTQEPFHLWEICVDGSGLRQLTRQNYHDISPAYLPDGRIVFNSTRVESFSLCQNYLASALYVMEADGADIHRLEYSTLCDTTPSVMSDGSILYGRWEYNDKNIFCTQALWTINPDGTHIQLFYGNTLTVPNAMYGGRQIPGTPKVVITMAPHHGIPIGAIGVIDPSHGRENVAGLVNITPEVPYVPTVGRTWRDYNWGPGDARYFWGYTDPWPVDDQVCLVSYGGPKGNSKPRHRLYVMNYQGDKTLVCEAPEMSCFNPVSLKPRPRPMVRAGTVPRAAGGMGTMIVQDVYQGLLDQGVKRGQVVSLRVLSQLPKKWNTEGPRQLDEYPLIGCGTYYVKYDYGTVPVSPAGVACFEAPAGVELYFEALDKDGKEIRRMGTVTQLIDGEVQSCVGCHEPRTTAPGNHVQELPSRLMRPPDTITPPPWGQGPVDYMQLVQPVLDRHCTSCHSGPTPKGRIDLSGDRTRFFCMSYEALAGSNRWVAGYHLHGAPTGNFPALATGSWASRLTALLEKDHYGVNLDQTERRRIYSWIDANIPYYGTWDMSRPRSTGGRDAWTVPAAEGVPAFASWTRQLDGYLATHCSSCHTSRPLAVKGNWTFAANTVNLTHPENSTLLTAHLAKTAGGLELTGKRAGHKSAVLFQTREDPLYLKLREILQAAKKHLQDHPREDQPGAKLIPQQRDFGKTF